MKRAIRAIVAALSLASFAIASPAVAAEPEPPAEGWASWEVPAVADAPAWCCLSSWDSRNAPAKPCQLDARGGGYGSRNGATTDSIRVYARLAEGKIKQLRTFSTACPVQANSKVQDLGAVAVDDSTLWLMTLLRQGEHDADLAHDLLAALAMHASGLARDELINIARNDERAESRKEAVFWLAHLHGMEGADIATFIMFNDSNADVREHAAFAVSQSKSPQAATYLIRLANTDKAPNVRAHAWFALSQTKASETEAAISAALQKETDRNVREQAIFALSQLPEERATRALIAAAENRSLPREDRKRAVFWLSQSESSSAQAYIERVIAKLPQ